MENNIKIECTRTTFRELKCTDVFAVAEDNSVVCTTTNGMIKQNGALTMGAGNAKQVRDMFKGIDFKLGSYVKSYGNRCFSAGKWNMGDGRIITLASFPTKYDWRDKSDLNLIKASALQIVEMANKFNWSKVYIPAPGVGNGGLNWLDVKRTIEPILDDRFVIVRKEMNDVSIV